MNIFNTKKLKEEWQRKVEESYQRGRKDAEDEFLSKKSKIEIDENIYSIFENELGRTLSPLEYEKIKEMVTSYGQELVVEALKEAVYNRANNLRYIETILSEWNKKGYKSKVDILKDRENYRKKKTDNIKLPDIDWLNEDE